MLGNALPASEVLQVLHVDRNETYVEQPMMEGSGNSIVLLMGVMGSGKTTVGNALSQQMGCVFRDADEFHSAANIDKMKSGTPLTDDDRLPWLMAISTWMSETLPIAKTIVMTCSALKRRYRELLRCAPLHSSSPSSSPSSSSSSASASAVTDALHGAESMGTASWPSASRNLPIRFVHLSVSKDTLIDRLTKRSGHFMNPSLLDSQLASLEALEPSEHGLVIQIDAERSVEDIVREIVERQCENV
jgi:gluconokinase